MATKKEPQRKIPLEQAWQRKVNRNEMADVMVMGRMPVLEALASGAPLRKIYVTESGSGGSFRDVIKEAEAKKIPLQTLSRQDLDRLAKTNKHQGVMALMPAVEYVDPEVLLENAAIGANRGKAALVLLDGVEDPRNLGAIVRVAEGAGMHGIVITKHRCAEMTAAAIKTSAGAAFHIPMAQVPNLPSLMTVLKKRGLWMVGLDERAEQSIYEIDATLPLAIVLGGEGKGLHRLVREKCDFVYRIPMRGKLASLNVSTAAAVVCYEVVRQRMAEKVKGATSKEIAPTDEKTTNG